MSGPQPSGEPASVPAGAASATGGDPGNWPGRNAAGESGHTGGPPSPSKWRQNNSMQYNTRPWHRDRPDSGPFKNRGWSNNNYRHLPYRHRNNNSNNGSWDRQERDYTQRTDYYTNDYHERRERSGETEIERSPRNPRNPEESYRNSGRYRANHHYKEQHHRYHHRWSGDNTAQPVQNGSIGEDSSSPPSSASGDFQRNTNESIELAENDPNCETVSAASKVNQQKNKSPSKKQSRTAQNPPSPSKSNVVKEKNLQANKNNAIHQSPVASKEPCINQKANNIKAQDSGKVASNKPSTVATEKRKTADTEINCTGSFEAIQVNGLSKDSGSNAYKAHIFSRTSPINDLNGTDSGTVAPRDQEISENISTAEARPSSVHPPRIQVRPLTQLLKEEIQAVTQENRLIQRPIGSPTPLAPVSSPSRPTFKPILKNRRRTVSNSNQNGGSQFADSETIINNRIAGMDKESLKYIINTRDTIYDEHLKVQARKRIREEIRRQLKAIKLDQPKDNPVTELVEDEIVDAIKLPKGLLQEIEKCFGRDFIEGKKVQDTDENLGLSEETKGSGTEVCENIQASEVCSTESATNSKDSDSIKDSEQSSKNSENQSNEQDFSLESVNQNEVTEETTKNNNRIGASSRIIHDDNEENDAINDEEKLSEGEIQELPIKKRLNRKQRRAMKRDLRSRLKAADEVKMMAERRLARNRGPLLPTPPCGKIPNSFDCPKDQDIEKVQSPTKKSMKTVAAGSESEAAALVTCPEIITPVHSEVKKEHCSSPIREMIPNSYELSKSNDQAIRKTPSPKQSSRSPKIKSTAEVASPDINIEIKSEHSTSPIRLSPFPKEVIELLSSSEEENGEDNSAVDMEIDDPEEDRGMELAPEPGPATVDDVASDHSTSSHCSNESEKRRFKLKLQSDAENVVNSFEKLILPHLRETLSDRYRHQHSVNLQSRLLFISCVVTSSEHNPQSFSKIEVAKIQRSLKDPDSRQGIEFLLREVVSIVKLQKQRRREQEEQVTVNGLSPREAEQEAREIPKASPSPSSDHTPDQRSPILPAHQSPVSLTCRENPSTSAARQSPPGLPTPQNPQPYPVGLPYMSMDTSLCRFSPAGYSQLRNGAYTAEPFGQMGDLLSHNIAEIDRHLMENQNRRSILEEMIMKFQKEKSHLETLSVELQSRKMMLMISSNHPALPAPPRSSHPRASSTREPVQVENIRQTRSRTRFRKAVLVKLMPKRVKRMPKRAIKKSANSEELIAQLQQEIADQEGRKQDQASSEESSPENLLAIKEELQDESVCDQVADSMPTVKPKATLLLSKPKASVSQQPLAIIPPLPPPPPPPDSICHLSDEPLTYYPEPNSQHNVGFVPQGKRLKVVSPITQIRIYKEYVIAAAEDGDIYMFHLISHKLERQITKHSEAITSMFLCEKDSILYTTSLDGFFKITSLENLERVLQTVYFKEPLQSIDIAWGMAFIGSRWGNIFTYNVSTNKQVDMPLLSTGGQSIVALKAAKEGVRRILILGCKGCYINMNDATNGLLLRRLCLPESLHVFSLLLNDGHIYCGTQKNQIFQFEFVTGDLVTKLDCGNGPVSIVPYKDQYLLAGCYDGYIYVLDKVTGKQVGCFVGPGRLILAVAVAGDKIVTSSKENILGILEVPAAKVNGQ